MNNTLANALRSGLDDINQDLYHKCDRSKYFIDLRRYENRDKDAITYDEQNNYDVILCLYYNKKCISSVTGRYHAEDNSMEILSKTHSDFENKKFNLYLRTAFIYLMCFVRPSIRTIYSFSENPISTYTMYKYFHVYNEDLNQFITENHLTPNTFTVEDAKKFHDNFKNKHKKTRESSQVELNEMLEDYSMEELGWESEEEAIDFIMNNMNRVAIPLSLSLQTPQIKDFLLSTLSNTMIKCNDIVVGSGRGGKTKRYSQNKLTKINRKKSRKTRKMRGGEVVEFNDGFYDGDVVNGQREGHGKMKYQNDDVFEGLWEQDDKKTGKMIYANKDIYEGEYEGDQRKLGKMIYHNGDVYEGEWRGDFQDNDKYGHGKMVYQNGDSYEGEWKFGKKYGQGKMVYKNGQVYDGIWENDKIGPKIKEDVKEIPKYDIRGNDKINTSVYFRINDLVNKLHNNSMQIDVNPNGVSYKNITKTIDKIIENGFLCKGLNREYILTAFDRADAVFVIYASDILPNETILGFALVKFLIYDESFYIDVICSHKEVKGAGEYLLKKMEEVSRKLSKKYIKLNSVNSAVTFYEKYGFKKENKTCNHMCLMIKGLGV